MRPHLAVRSNGEVTLDKNVRGSAGPPSPEDGGLQARKTAGAPAPGSAVRPSFLLSFQGAGDQF